MKEILKPIDGLIGLDNWWERTEIICDKLIETAQGNVDKEWWKYVFSMKRHGMGSGSFTTYDGWFLRDLLNISRIESFRSLPSGLVSVPLVFDDNGCESEGAIVSGISGIKIDESKDVPIVESIHGWAIFH